MTTTITAPSLDRIAPTLDAEAREAAHAVVDMAAPEAVRVQSFCSAYVYALATLLGERSAAQCGAGERWEPADWLRSDYDAVEEAGEELGVAIDWAHCWALYSR